MNNWQDWVAATVAIWCAWRVIRAFVNPFFARACGGCAGGCGHATKRQEMLHIE